MRFRPRSVKEMAQRLKQKGHRGFIITKAIDQLEEQNLLDDRLFAKLWIGDRITLKPSGKNLLVRELKAKGVSEAVIDAAFEGLQGAYDEYEIALPLARRKYDRMKGLEDKRSKKKLLDFLNRRGFSYDTIWRILKELYKNAEIEP